MNLLTDIGIYWLGGLAVLIGMVLLSGLITYAAARVGARAEQSQLDERLRRRHGPDHGP